MARVGTKRADRRWKDSDGVIWASEYEYRIYEGLRAAFNGAVQRCEKGSSSTFSYDTPVPGGACPSCGCDQVVQRRTYTPDVYLDGQGDGATECGRLHFEVKGYFSAEKRNLLRHFRNANPDVNLCIILQRNGSATKKRSLGEYIDTYLKIPWFVWDIKRKPEMPEDLKKFIYDFAFSADKE